MPYKKPQLFYFTWPSFLFFLSMLMLLCYLGQWQHHRYQFKKRWVQDYHQAQMAPPTSFNPASPPPALTRVKLTGHYLNKHTLFLENQRNNQGMNGFHVLTPFQSNNTKKTILVDRGWVPALRNTSLPPHVVSIKKETTLSGMWIKPEIRGFILGPNIPEPNKKPLMIQKIIPKDIANATHLPLYSHIIQLDPHSAGGFSRHWTLPSLPPQRHLGYMIQWYAMALTLCVLYLYWGFAHAKKQPKNSRPV